MDLEMLRVSATRPLLLRDVPGAKASEEWQRHRYQLEREHEHHTRSSPSAMNDPTEKSSDSE